MSLRRKDDWDEALEQADGKKANAFVPGPDYDYGVTVRLPRSQKKPDYPARVCFACGEKWGRNKKFHDHGCTVHFDTCGICGDERPVTEPRDFGHLKPGWEVDAPNKNKS